MVKDCKIISTGYNGSPRGHANCIDESKCVREELKIPKGERYELCNAVHAEQNAIIFAEPQKMEGATLYIAGTDSGEPCNICLQMATNAKIKKIIYKNREGEIECVYIN